MIVTLIAALARGRVIGSAGGGIPWTLPRDRTHFRAYTAGKWLAVGRRTYGEMRHWFDDRVPIVVTRDATLRTENPAHRAAGSITAAIDLARANAARELVVCGGAALYAAALPHADRLVLTRIDADIVGEVVFPDFEAIGEWALIAATSWPADEENSHPMRLEVRHRTG